MRAAPSLIPEPTVYCLLLKRVALRVEDFAVAGVGDDTHLVEAFVGVGREVRQGELTGEQRVQLAQVVVETDRGARALEEGAPARLVRQELERALAVVEERELAAAYARRVHRVDGDAEPLRLVDQALEVEALRRRSVRQSPREVDAVADDQHGAAADRLRLEALDGVPRQREGVVGRGRGRRERDAQGLRRALQVVRKLLPDAERARTQITDHHARARRELTHE